MSSGKDATHHRHIIAQPLPARPSCESFVKPENCVWCPFCVKGLRSIRTMCGKCYLSKLKTEACNKCPGGSWRWKLIEGCYSVTRMMDAPRMKIEWCDKCPWGTYHCGIFADTMKVEGCWAFLFRRQLFNKRWIQRMSYDTVSFSLLKAGCSKD